MIIPTIVNNTFLNSIISLDPNVVNIVVVNVIIDTHADTNVTDLAAEYTGLLNLRYLMKLYIAKLNVKKVYAANAMVVISWW